MTGHTARNEERRNVCRILVGKARRIRPLGRPRRRWEDKLKVDLRELVYDNGRQLGLAQISTQWRVLILSLTFVFCYYYRDTIY
jgi:hypothetical protein